MAYIYAGPGSTTKVELEIFVAGETTNGLTIPALQDITIEAANDVFSFSSLESDSVTQVATVATNSVSGNLVVDSVKFFGNSATGAINYSSLSQIDADVLGIFGLSKQKIKIDFNIRLGVDEDAGLGLTIPTISGSGYITGLSPNISADSPVWQTSFTIVGDAPINVSRSDTP